MQEESFRSRYLVKITSSVIIAALNMVIQVILPRALSVEEFGYYSYNLNVFTSTVVLANLSMSNALVAKFSKRTEEIGIVFFYLKYYLVEILFLSIGLLALFSLDFIRHSFAGQGILTVFLGLEVALATKLLGDAISILDAMAIAKISAFYQIILKIVVASFVLCTYLLGRLNLLVFYCGQILGITFIGLVLINIAVRYQRKKYPREVIGNKKQYIKEYFVYCRPLVLSAIASQFIIILMNWLLIRYAGVKEQAMFGVAWQLNTLVSYIFSPYAELSKREHAVLSEDKELLGRFYLNSLKRMFWITSYFACFIGFCSSWILELLFGAKYTGAETATMLIMIYTIYQAWGQINGSFMLATERTKMNAVIGILNQLIVLVLVLVFQVPNLIWPKGLGSVGIALVYLISNILIVYIMVYAVSKDLGLSLWKSLKIQVVPLLLCSLVSINLSYLMDLFLHDTTFVTVLCKLLFAGIVYTLVIFAVIFIFPELIALNKKDILKIKKKWKG